MYFIYIKKNYIFLFCITLRFKEKKREKGGGAGGSMILTTLSLQRLLLENGKNWNL